MSCPVGPAPLQVVGYRCGPLPRMMKFAGRAGVIWCLQLINMRHGIAMAAGRARLQEAPLENSSPPSLFTVAGVPFYMGRVLRYG